MTEPLSDFCGPGPCEQTLPFENPGAESLTPRAVSKPYITGFTLLFDREGVMDVKTVPEALIERDPTEGDIRRLAHELYESLRANQYAMAARDLDRPRSSAERLQAKARSLGLI